MTIPMSGYIKYIVMIVVWIVIVADFMQKRRIRDARVVWLMHWEMCMHNTAKNYNTVLCICL